MSGSIKIAGHELVSHDIANDKLVYGTGVPAGTILQVTSGRGASARYDTSSTTFVSITSATDVATLTTKFAGSKFFLSMTLSFQLNSNHQFIVDFRRVVAGVTTQNITGVDGGVTSQFGESTQWKSISYSHLDSPNLAAGTTVSYGLSARVLGGTLYLNDYAANTFTNITAMEIKT